MVARTCAGKEGKRNAPGPSAQALRAHNHPQPIPPGQKQGSMWERRNKPSQRCLHTVGPQGMRASSNQPPRTPVRSSFLDHTCPWGPGQHGPRWKAVCFLPVSTPQPQQPSAPHPCRAPWIGAAQDGYAALRSPPMGLVLPSSPPRPLPHRSGIFLGLD